jgi:hypothetical protein
MLTNCYTIQGSYAYTKSNLTGYSKLTMYILGSGGLGGIAGAGRPGGGGGGGGLQVSVVDLNYNFATPGAAPMTAIDCTVNIPAPVTTPSYQSTCGMYYTGTTPSTVSCTFRPQPGYTSSSTTTGDWKYSSVESSGGGEACDGNNQGFMSGVYGSGGYEGYEMATSSGSSGCGWYMGAPGYISSSICYAGTRGGNSTATAGGAGGGPPGAWNFGGTNGRGGNGSTGSTRNSGRPGAVCFVLQ